MALTLIHSVRDGLMPDLLRGTCTRHFADLTYRRTFCNPAVHEVFWHHYSEPRCCRRSLRHREHRRVAFRGSMLGYIRSASWNGPRISHLRNCRGNPDRWDELVVPYGRSFPAWHGSRPRAVSWAQLRRRNVIPEVAGSTYRRLPSMFLPRYNRVDLAGVWPEPHQDGSYLSMETTTCNSRPSLCHYSLRYLVHSRKPSMVSLFCFACYHR